MRTIKCRGWEPEHKIWVYGSYFEHCNCAVCFSNDDRPEYHEHVILFDQMTDWSLPNRALLAAVVPESVGEYAGCTLDGKEVYEGDILYLPDETPYEGIVKFGPYNEGPGVSYDMGFYVDWQGAAKGCRKDLGFWINHGDVKIAGNIFERGLSDENKRTDK